MKDFKLFKFYFETVHEYSLYKTSLSEQFAESFNNIIIQSI